MEEKEKLAIGDIVQLKSGGPKMTVSGFYPNSALNVVCTWFDGTKREQEKFAENALKKIQPEGTGGY